MRIIAVVVIADDVWTVVVVLVASKIVVLFMNAVLVVPFVPYDEDECLSITLKIITVMAKMMQLQKKVDK